MSVLLWSLVLLQRYRSKHLLFPSSQDAFKSPATTHELQSPTNHMRIYPSRRRSSRRFRTAGEPFPMPPHTSRKPRDGRIIQIVIRTHSAIVPLIFPGHVSCCLPPIPSM